MGVLLERQASHLQHWAHSVFVSSTLAPSATFLAALPASSVQASKAAIFCGARRIGRCWIHGAHWRSWCIPALASPACTSIASFRSPPWRKPRMALKSDAQGSETQRRVRFHSSACARFGCSGQMAHQASDLGEDRSPSAQKKPVPSCLQHTGL